MRYLIGMLVVLLAPAAASGDQRLIYHFTASVEKIDDRSTEMRFFDIRADGRWRSEHRKSVTGGSKTTQEQGQIASKAARLLMARVRRAARKRELPSKVLTVAEPAAVLAVYGFGRPLRLHTHRDGALPAVRKLLTLSVPKPKPAKRRISRNWFTNAGEGARSHLTFDSNGRLETGHGGDIGCGYDIHTVRRRMVDQPTTKALLDKVAKLVTNKQIKRKKPSGLSMQGTSFKLEGFGSKVMEIDGASPLGKKLNSAINSLTGAQPELKPPFPVHRIGYSAELADRKRKGKTRDVEGTFYATGHWVVKDSSGNRLYFRVLSHRQLVRLFTAVQRAVDSPPPPIVTPSSTKAPRGVWSVELYSHGSHNNRLLLSGAGLSGLQAALKRILQRQLVR